VALPPSCRRRWKTTATCGSNYWSPSVLSSWCSSNPGRLDSACRRGQVGRRGQDKHLAVIRKRERLWKFQQWRYKKINKKKEYSVDLMSHIE
jgi:hypothetical protein